MLNAATPKILAIVFFGICFMVRCGSQLREDLTCCHPTPPDAVCTSLPAETNLVLIASRAAEASGICTAADHGAQPGETLQPCSLTAPYTSVLPVYSPAGSSRETFRRSGAACRCPSFPSSDTAVP